MRSTMKTRVAVAAAAATALMGIGVGLVLGQTTFNDVPDSDPRSEDIDYAAAQGWFRGYPDGSFRPDRQISEDQLARVIRRAHPGLNRGDAAVFLRGGADRLRTAGLTTTAVTTTTLRTGGPGGGAPVEPGGGGPVDPNPPVAVEPTTATTATPAGAATTTTTSTEAGTTTTTTGSGGIIRIDATGGETTTTTEPSGPTTTVPAGVGERNVVRAGFDAGWRSAEGQNGSLFWLEFDISGYRFPDDAYLSNWWQANGSAQVTITGRDDGGRAVVRRVSIESNPSTFYPFQIESVEVTCNHDCTYESNMAMPAGTRNWAEQFGYTKPSAATTTTTTSTTQPAPSPTFVYGKEDGWRNKRNVAGSVVWWEFRNWGSATLWATINMSYGGSLIIEEDEPYPYWFSLRDEAFSITSISCNGCTATESSTMPDSTRNQLTADGYTKSDG